MRSIIVVMNEICELLWMKLIFRKYIFRKDMSDNYITCVPVFQCDSF